MLRIRTWKPAARATRAAPRKTHSNSLFMAGPVVMLCLDVRPVVICLSEPLTAFYSQLLRSTCDPNRCGVTFGDALVRAYFTIISSLWPSVSLLLDLNCETIHALASIWVPDHVNICILRAQVTFQSRYHWSGIIIHICKWLLLFYIRKNIVLLHPSVRPCVMLTLPPLNF